MVFEFKTGTRVPTSVTANGVVAERDAIEQKLSGKFTSEGAATQVLSFPDLYPNLRAVCPKDPEAALFELSRQKITWVLSAVIPYSVATDNIRAPQVRAFAWVRDPDGGPNLINKPLQVIAKDMSMRKYLLEELQKDAEVFSRKLLDTIGELNRLG